MRSILRKLRYMDLDVLFTALVRRDEDQDTGATMYGPAAPPALQQDLLGYADLVIRTERRASADGKSEEIVGYTYPDENHHGKDRFGVLPPELHAATESKETASMRLTSNGFRGMGAIVTTACSGSRRTRPIWRKNQRTLTILTARPWEQPGTLRHPAVATPPTGARTR